MRSRPSPTGVLLVGLAASLVTRIAEAALGTSKPPDVVYRTPSPAPTVNARDAAQQAANQAVGTLQGVLDALQTVTCKDGVCTFPNGTVTGPTLPPTTKPAILLPGTISLQPTSRPTPKPTIAPTRPTPAPTTKPPTVAPAPAPTAAAPGGSQTPGGGTADKNTGGGTADKQVTPGPTQAPVDPRLPRGGAGPGGVAAVQSAGEKKPFNYMGLVWAAVALWGAIIVAIGMALFVQRGRAKPQQPLAASGQQQAVDV